MSALSGSGGSAVRPVDILRRFCFEHWISLEEIVRAELKSTG